MPKIRNKCKKFRIFFFGGPGRSQGHPGRPAEKKNPKIFENFSKIWYYMFTVKHFIILAAQFFCQTWLKGNFARKWDPTNAEVTAPLVEILVNKLREAAESVMNQLERRNLG